MSTETRSAAADARQGHSSPLMHIYLPWSRLRVGAPPVGAKALCGHVRRSARTGSVDPDHPNACVVCAALSEGI